MTKIQLVVLMIGTIALMFVLLALQLLAPGEIIDETAAGGAHIVLSVDQGMLFAPGACVTVRWQVDHIQAVYFDDFPTIGKSFKQVCTDTQMLPVLRVKFQDGTSQDYQPQVKFLVEQPATWLLGYGAVLLVILSLAVSLHRPSAAVTEASGRRTPRLVLIFAAIGLIVSIFAGGALLLEVGLRAYFGSYGTRTEKTTYLFSRAEIQTQNDSMTLPFVGFAPSPDFPGHNQLGYRGEDIQVPKPAGVYRIVVLGDSSTYGARVPYDQTYPADLQKILRADYGYKNLEVVNGGVPIYMSWNMVMDLIFRVTELQPDLVIVYAGWNDLGSREQSPDCYNTPDPFLGLAGNYFVRAQPADVSPLALSRFLAVGFGWMPAPTSENVSYASPGFECSPQIASEIFQNLEANPPVYFERNLREMSSVAKSFGSKIMFMTWAYNKNSPFVSEDRRVGIAEHNVVTTRVAQETGAIFFDYAPIASTDKASWADVPHLSILGGEQQAEKMAQFLIDHDVITQQPGT